MVRSTHFFAPNFRLQHLFCSRENLSPEFHVEKAFTYWPSSQKSVICRRLLSERLYRLGSAASDRDVASSAAFRRYRHFFLDVLATAHARGVNHVNEICGLSSAVAVVTIVVVICRKCIEAAVRRKIIEVSVIARVPEIL